MQTEEFGLKERHDFTKDLLSRDQYKKIKEFTSNPEITVRKADKSNTFVIMNTDEYINKIDAILSDSTKFRKVTKDPSDALKSEINKLITTINGHSDCNMSKVIGHYEPGYIYGNPKIHKSQNDPPLRPIISQVGTVTYDIAKWMNSLITPYMPQKFTINSTNDFIKIAQTVKDPNFLAFLDVESVFTNVPVEETIEIIVQNVYQNAQLPPPNIPKTILQKLLLICTTKNPFKTPTNEIYQQCNGVSMGTPLGPTFANFYMCNLENKFFNNNPQLKPKVYCRYVDDILLVLDSFEELTVIIAAM